MQGAFSARTVLFCPINNSVFLAGRGIRLSDCVSAWLALYAELEAKPTVERVDENNDKQAFGLLILSIVDLWDLLVGLGDISDSQAGRASLHSTLGASREIVSLELTVQ